MDSKYLGNVYGDAKLIEVNAKSSSTGKEGYDYVLQCEKEGHIFTRRHPNSFKNGTVCPICYNMSDDTAASKKRAVLSRDLTGCVYENLTIINKSVAKSGKPTYDIKCSLCSGVTQRYIGKLEELKSVVCKTCGNKGKRWDGKFYKSDKVCAEAYCVSSPNVSRLKQKGWSLEEICTGAYKEETEIVDHLGNKYDSIKARAEAYGLDYGTVKSRLNVHRWDLKRALTTPVEEQIDWTGLMTEDVIKEAETFGVTSEALRVRLSYGWGIAEAIGKEGRGLEVRISKGAQLNPYIEVIKTNTEGARIRPLLRTLNGEKLYVVFIIEIKQYAIMSATMINNYPEDRDYLLFDKNIWIDG